MLSLSSVSSMSLLREPDYRDEELDLDAAEKHLPKSAVRLAMQKAVNAVQSGIGSTVLKWGVLRMVLCVGTVVFVVLYGRALLDEQIALFDTLRDFDEMGRQYSAALAQLPWFVYNGTLENGLPMEKIIEGQMLDYYVKLGRGLGVAIQSSVRKAQEALATRDYAELGHGVYGI
jgi:hypothetical protein